MRVGDVMTRRVKAVRQEDGTAQAIRLLQSWRIRHLPVVDVERRVVGIVTPSDLLESTPTRGQDRRLVAEIMRRPVITARADEELDAAAARMREEGVHGLPVVDAAGRLAGMLTDVDVLAALARSRPSAYPPAPVSVDSVMTGNPVTLEADASLGDAAETLLRGGFRHLPVVDEQGRLVGMLSERDLRTRLGVEMEGFWDATLEALSEPVSEAMTPDPVSVRSGTPLAKALDALALERVGALPVVDEADQLLGILSYVDVLAWLKRNPRLAGGSAS